MALTFGFYNSLDGDRKYDAMQMSQIFDGIINDGVFQSIDDFFATKPSSGLSVTVGTGRAWFDHTWTLNDALIPLTVDAADPTLTRIDAVVLEVDSSELVRANSIKIVKGTAASNPTKPAMTNTDTLHQHPLAYITVKPGMTEVKASEIEIMVGKSECPFVTAILETTDIDAVFAQWESQFTAWFENVQSQLEGDVATNLQRQIDDLQVNPSTALLYGLSSDAKPDNVFAWIGKYAQHWWKRRKTTGGWSVSGTTISGDGSSSSPYKYIFGAYSKNDAKTTSFDIQYSDELEIDVSGSIKGLKSPVKTVSVSYETYTNAEQLRGKYFMRRYVDTQFPNNSADRGLAYISESAIIKRDAPYSTEAYVYPDNMIINLVAKSVPGPWEYVQSSDRSAYPDSGEQNGYEYEYLGVPFDNAVEAPKIPEPSLDERVTNIENAIERGLSL